MLHAILPPTWSQDPPTWSQDSPQKGTYLPKAPKMPQDATKMPPRPSQDLPKAPKTLQKSIQSSPKASQKPSKRLPRSSKIHPKATQKQFTPPSKLPATNEPYGSTSLHPYPRPGGGRPAPPHELRRCPAPHVTAPRSRMSSAAVRRRAEHPSLPRPDFV